MTELRHLVRAHLELAGVLPMPECYRAVGFRESDHPREKAGTSEGGQFVSAEKSSETVTSKTGEVKSREKWTMPGGGDLPDWVRKAIPPGWTDVKIASTPEAKYVVIGRDSKGREQRWRSDWFAAQQDQKKWKRAATIRKSVADMRSRSQQLRQHDTDTADVFLLVSTMGLRPGSDVETGAEHESFGATTLEGRHVVIGQDGSVSLVFPPAKKHGQVVTLPVVDPAVAKMLVDRRQLAGEASRLFNTTAPKLRQHVKAVGGEELKAKDLRTAVGTETAARQIDTMIEGGTKPKTQKELAAVKKQISQAVADVLGNTWKISLDSYIDPAVWAPLEKGLENERPTERSGQERSGRAGAVGSGATERAGGAGVERFDARHVATEHHIRAALELAGVIPLPEQYAATSATGSDIDRAVSRWKEPSEAQKDAGNYHKPRIMLHGIEVAIENPRGTRRRPEWPPLAHHYGYASRLAGSPAPEAKDGDKIDIFIGPHPESEIVYVVDQEHPSGRYDEPKVLMGFRTEDEARAGYLENYTEGWHCGPITAMTVKQFKAWLQSGDTKRRVDEQVSKYQADLANAEQYAAHDVSTEPRDNEGKWIAGGALHTTLVADPSEQAKFFQTGQATAFRIHDGDYPLPKKSKSTWAGDDEEEMPGVSGYANLINAIDDMLFGASESATGENYSSQVGNPTVVVMTGRYIDGPGAEVIVPKPKIAAIITKAEMEAAFRETLPDIGVEDDVSGIPLEELIDRYEWTASDKEAITARVMKNAARNKPEQYAARGTSAGQRSVLGSGGHGERRPEKQQVRKGFRFSIPMRPQGTVAKPVMYAAASAESYAARKSPNSSAGQSSMFEKQHPREPAGVST